MPTNLLLSSVGQALRRSRPLVPDDYHSFTRVEPSYGGNYVEVWFRTRGCRHDWRGGCTMCNYGVSSPPSEEAMVGYVAEALRAVTVPVRDLLISPSGSMFDPWEVPAGARQAILTLANSVRSTSFSVETRAETVDEACIAELCALVPGRELCVEVGLESADPWVLQYCVNKALDRSEVSRAAAIMRRYGVLSRANISVGTCFLSEAEAIQDAVTTARWAFAEGIDRCVLFPIHVKPYTVAEWLWRREQYHPPSLWSLVEVIRRLGSELTPHVEISWYKSYYVEEDWVSASPDTCPRCYERVIALLDTYRDTPDYGLLDAIEQIGCGCREAWLAKLAAPAEQPLSQRVAALYRLMAAEIMGQPWLEHYEERILPPNVFGELEPGT